MATPTILCYNLDSQTFQALQSLCEAQGLALRRVSPFEYGLPVGALAGIPVAAKPKIAPGGFSDPMLLMCHLLSPQLDAFLQGMRDNGIPRIALKAILTPGNVGWTSLELRNELAREHETITRRNR